MDNKKGIIGTIGVAAIIAGTLSFIYGMAYHLIKGGAWYHIVVGAIFLVAGSIITIISSKNQND